jgi:hypothetical protein
MYRKAFASNFIFVSFVLLSKEDFKGAEPLKAKKLKIQAPALTAFFHAVIGPPLGAFESPLS